jgi:tetratricopeptide (TPR) repeat protein
MDMGSPVEAEKTLLRALERLEGARKAFEKRGVAGRRSPIDSQIAGVLVSLAVNANVKLRDPDKAVAFFERAFEIDRSDFMRVLLACYRARVGRADEARAALRDVPVAPGNYYNLACTYALLGETELAIDFLKRDFDEVRTAAGARDRQQQWAREDPDLASLREDPRFVELVRGSERNKGR